MSWHLQNNLGCEEVYSTDWQGCRGAQVKADYHKSAVYLWYATVWESEFGGTPLIT